MSNQNTPVQAITGRLGKNPVLYHRDTKKGRFPVAKFSLATEVFGNGQVSTMWFQCSAWEKRSETVMKHLRKGDAVQLHGFASVEKFTGKDGKVVEYNHFNVVYVTFLGKAKANQADAPAQAAEPAAQAAAVPGVQMNPF